MLKRSARDLTFTFSRLHTPAAQKLRALLARCPEWSQDTARLALAETLAGRAECVRLVSCLRGADTMATLRKVDLIALARAWGYRSSQWRRRRACSRATHRALADLGGAEGGDPKFTPKAGREGAKGGAAAAVRAPAAAPGGQVWDTGVAGLAATRAVLEPFDCASLSSDDVARYGEERLKRLANDAVRLLSGQEAFAAAVNHGWAHITPALCAEIEAANSHLEVLLAKWAATLTAVLVLRDEMRQCADDVAWRALAGRESALPIHEMMRQMQAFMDRGVAQINETRRRRGDVLAPPAVEAWLNELHRSRMMALELIARSQALLINARFAHVQMFLGVCMLVHGACTHFFTQGRASVRARLADSHTHTLALTHVLPMSLPADASAPGLDALAAGRLRRRRQRRSARRGGCGCRSVRLALRSAGVSSAAAALYASLTH